MARISTDNWTDQPRTLLFEEDAPDGGCIVICPCGERFNEKDEEVCPGCGRDLIFPGWAEW